jgi:AcrR family transcriptional regulator
VKEALRLPAAERRRAILDAAVDVFTSGSYRGCTTAEIARAAGVSEPILYRHFGSKRDLYIAVLDHVWAEVRVLWDAALAAEPDPRLWIQAINRVSLAGGEAKLVLPELWVHSLSEAGEDEGLRRHLREHIREVHDYIADVMRRGQDEGVILPERDVEAEAWITLAGGMLGTIGRRVGLLSPEDFLRIRASRVEWMSGKKPD